jgi:dephospho-CoA kinase
MKPIGITGGIAEGKSTVLAMLADLGFQTASADDVAREVRSEPEVIAKIAHAAGLTAGFQPAELRAVLTDPVVRRAVNGVMHRPVLSALFATGAEFLEVPLLIETCLQDKFREIWVVTCGREEQLMRLISRYGVDEAMLILALQLPTRAKVPFATQLVRTNRPLESVRESITQLAKNHRQL